jgi:hypothetical protein
VWKNKYLVIETAKKEELLRQDQSASIKKCHKINGQSNFWNTFSGKHIKKKKRRENSCDFETGKDTLVMQ